MATLSFCTPTQYLTINIDRRLLSRTNFYLNMLASDVRTYNWRWCNKAHLYRTVKMTSDLLHQIKEHIITDEMAGNEVQGHDNVVYGTGNIVLGSKNQVIGFNNWVFVSGYNQCPSGRIHVDEGVLVIGNHHIQLSKISTILRDPTLAIRLINAQ